ncbi:hypothetical protein [Longispora urticae]
MKRLSGLSRFAQLAIAVAAIGALVAGGSLAASAAGDSVAGESSAAVAACVKDWKKNPGQTSQKMCNLLRYTQAHAKSAGYSFSYGCRRKDPGSAHNTGDACDLFLNKTNGDKLAGWLRTNGNNKGMAYEIWYGAFAYADGGWNTSRGGGGCDYPRTKLAALQKLKKTNPSRYKNQWTTCHYDHIHVSVDPNH